MSSETRLHLLKLCVGAAQIGDLRDWQTGCAAVARAAGRDPRPVCTTRMWPKRREALLAGGSLYWVFKGFVLARQRIIGLEAVMLGDGVERCGIRLDPVIVATEAQPRRPFQGWRYLDPAEAPPDIQAAADGAALPPALSAALSDLGVTARRARAG